MASDTRQHTIRAGRSGTYSRNGVRPHSRSGTNSSVLRDVRPPPSEGKGSVVVTWVKANPYTTVYVPTVLVSAVVMFFLL